MRRIWMLCALMLSLTVLRCRQQLPPHVVRSHMGHSGHAPQARPQGQAQDSAQCELAADCR